MKKICKSIACVIAAVTLLSTNAITASALEPQNITLTKDVNLTYVSDCAEISIGKDNFYNLTFDKKIEGSDSYTINAEGITVDSFKPEADKALTVAVTDNTEVKQKFIYNIKLSKDETKTIEGIISYDKDGLPSTVLFKENFSFSYSGKNYDGVLYATYDLNTGKLEKTEANDLTGSDSYYVYDTNITYTTIFSKDKTKRFVVTNDKAPILVNNYNAMMAIALNDKKSNTAFDKLITTIAANTVPDGPAEPYFVSDEFIVSCSEYEMDMSVITHFNNALTFTKGTRTSNPNIISYTENKDGKVVVDRFKF